MKKPMLRAAYYNALYCFSVIVLFAWFMVSFCWKALKKWGSCNKHPTTYDDHLYDWEEYM